MRVVIFTGGVMRQGSFTRQAIQEAERVIAADSGGRTALDFGVTPSVVIGDFDSLDKAARVKLEQANCQFIAHPTDKDQTDTELAIQYAVDQSASQISIIGGSEGDRLDHVLANLFVAAHAAVPVCFVNGNRRAWSVTGPSQVEIKGNIGDLISLIPLTDEVTNVTTHGLTYKLKDETLYQRQARGISNVLSAAQARVDFMTGRLLIVQTAIGD